MLKGLVMVSPSNSNIWNVLGDNSEGMAVQDPHVDVIIEFGNRSPNTIINSRMVRQHQPQGAARIAPRDWRHHCTVLNHREPIDSTERFKKRPKSTDEFALSMYKTLLPTGKPSQRPQDLRWPREMHGRCVCRRCSKRWTKRSFLENRSRVEQARASIDVHLYAEKLQVTV